MRQSPSAHHGASVSIVVVVVAAAALLSRARARQDCAANVDVVAFALVCDREARLYSDAGVCACVFVDVSSQTQNTHSRQNPPSIPAMALVWFSCLLRRSKMIVDWHNYGFTLLDIGLRGGESSSLVRRSATRAIVASARIYEGATRVLLANGRTRIDHRERLSHFLSDKGFFGRLADANMCVTRAMQNDLRRRWSVAATVLYDKPPSRFRECAPSSDARQSLRAALAQRIGVAALERASADNVAVLVSSTRLRLSLSLCLLVQFHVFISLSLFSCFFVVGVTMKTLAFCSTRSSVTTPRGRCQGENDHHHRRRHRCLRY